MISGIISVRQIDEATGVPIVNQGEWQEGHHQGEVPGRGLTILPSHEAVKHRNWPGLSEVSGPVLGGSSSFCHTGFPLLKDLG